MSCSIDARFEVLICQQIDLRIAAELFVLITYLESPFRVMTTHLVK